MQLQPAALGLAAASIKIHAVAMRAPSLDIEFPIGPTGLEL